MYNYYLYETNCLDKILLNVKYKWFCQSIIICKLDLLNLIVKVIDCLKTCSVVSALSNTICIQLMFLIDLNNFLFLENYKNLNNIRFKNKFCLKFFFLCMCKNNFKSLYTMNKIDINHEK